jgi:hypothetical protein
MPRPRIDANPNAPYVVETSSKPPQLVKRADESGSGTMTEGCRDKNLTVTEIAAALNGSYHAVKLAFYNQGLTPCKIGGFPTVSLLDQHGNPVASVAIERVTESAVKAKLEPGSVQQSSAAQPVALVIAPRGEAWFQLGWLTGDGCPEVSRISVSAPESSESFTINHPLDICDGKLEITALRGDDQD